MRLLLQKTAALAVCFLLASCAAFPKPEIGLQGPLPAALAAGCQAPAAAPPMTGEVDAVALALKGMYDAYGLCAGRVLDLLNWIDGGHP